MVKLLKLSVPIKEPYWKHRAFGLSKEHFLNAERIQCKCDYRNRDGELEFPYLYEIDSSKAFNVRVEEKKYGNKTPVLLVIPIDQFDKVELRKE